MSRGRYRVYDKHFFETLFSLEFVTCEFVPKSLIILLIYIKCCTKAIAYQIQQVIYIPM